MGSCPTAVLKRRAPRRRSPVVVRSMVVPCGAATAGSPTLLRPHASPLNLAPPQGMH